MKTKKSPARSRSIETAVHMPSAFMPIGMSLLFGVIVFAVVLMLFALIMSVQDIPVVLFGSMSVAALILGGVVSGFCIGKYKRTSGLFYGCICGGLLYAMIFALSLLIGEEIGLAAMLKLIIAMLSGAIGGVLGVNMRVRHKNSR